MRDATGALLVCGNRNYSSWSLRAWLCLRKAGVDFETRVLPMDTAEFAAQIGALSPTRRVPVLHLGSERIWDSLAIAETVSERFAGGRLWPADMPLRALGRAMAAEMHAGFGALREALPMNCRARDRHLPIPERVLRDIDRIVALWRQALDASGGPWLLGEWSIADAMYAPVVLRFRAYIVALPPDARAYCAHWLQDPDLQTWCALAAEEPWVIEHEEVGVAAGEDRA
jgi:glutathione S-transferase